MTKMSVCWTMKTHLCIGQIARKPAARPVTFFQGHSSLHGVVGVPHLIGLCLLLELCLCAPARWYQKDTAKQKIGQHCALHQQFSAGDKSYHGRALHERQL